MNDKSGELVIEEAVPGIWTVTMTLEDGSTDRKTIAVPDGTAPEDVLAHVVRAFKNEGVEVGDVEVLDVPGT